MGLLGDALNVAKDAVLAPAEVAHAALTEMFGGSDADLQKIAKQLSELSQQMDTLSGNITAAVEKLTWRGPAADAFISYAQARVKETKGVADDLAALSKSVTRLADVY
ncbi:WXG100 family type VII secretion target [Streptacidiphilus sp. EB129]|uniref:WXG100 family type VII secretion target n=1 Tax=Streptacidiphilus sp. EB129 TaxID=3156262 RepID=UPI003511D0FB